MNIHQTLYDVNLQIDIESKVGRCKSKDGICFKDGFELFRNNGNNKNNLNLHGTDPSLSTEHRLKFTFVGNIAGNATSEERSITTFTLSIKEFRKITFGIKSTGGCGTVLRIKVYYFVCELLFVNKVVFKKTLSPKNGTKVVFGSCPANTGLVSSTGDLKAFCHSNGSWSIGKGEMVCRCEKGYEPTSNQDCYHCSGMFLAYRYLESHLELIALHSTHTEVIHTEGRHYRGCWGVALP